MANEKVSCCRQCIPANLVSIMKPVAPTEGRKQMLPKYLGGGNPLSFGFTLGVGREDMEGDAASSRQGEDGRP